ncbi:DUF2970 domain-containing protein [Neptunicella marina]|uniref:DUF2970 domain-containing protein n=1 Tax=Neptunicella marina TaxID=2125989 RepID=A0A8J6IYG3_9ALTE|nr:DUF2970 domain-containing protein [Neptunicella marina]
MKNWWRVVKSVAASALGVQSEANRQHDFQQNSIVPYLVVGVLFLVLFIISLITIVKLVAS